MPASAPPPRRRCRLASCAEGICNERNLGNLFRSADAFGEPKQRARNPGGAKKPGKKIEGLHARVVHATPPTFDVARPCD